MERAMLLDLAAQYGTPAFVFDEGAFVDRAHAVRSIFGDDINLCYAIKANPFLIPAAVTCFDRLEVCSPGELDICKSLGVDPGMIVFSGVNKTPESVADAISYGVGVLTAESLKHARLIEAEAASKDICVDMLIRLNAGSQFGMSRDDFLWLVDHRGQFAHVNFVGIHYFVGTQRKKLKHQRDELAMLSQFIDDLREEHGFVVERLEYGPGLAVPLFEGEDFADTLAPARDILEPLSSLAAKVDLTVEMGRFFATPCGTYLTAVNDTKQNEGTNYCIVDGGINHLTYYGQLMGMKTPIIENLSESDERDTEDTVNWCICGSLCTTGDVLTRGADLGDLREGDVLAFENSGAYAVTEGVNLFLSRPMASVIMVSPEGVSRCARSAVETSTFNVESR